jgi:hypothetical protein
MSFNITQIANGVLKVQLVTEGSDINFIDKHTEYGVREVVGQSSPTFERVRRFNGQLSVGTDTGLSAAVGTDDSVVYNSFDSVYIFGRRKKVVIEADDGASGKVENTFVEVPKYYIKEEWLNDDGTVYHYLWMCATKLDGYRLPLPFLKSDGSERDFAYIGAYEAYLDSNSKLRSISDVFPKVDYSRANFRTAARKLDTNDSASNYQITDVSEYVDLVQIPMMIEFATKNMQTIMYGAFGMAYSDSHVATSDGVASADANTAIVANATAEAFVIGQTIGVGTTKGGNQIASDRVITAIDEDTPSAGSSTITYDGDAVQALTNHYIYSLAWKTGILDIAKSSSAIYDEQQKRPIIWRGIENPYGNIWKNIDGIKIVDNKTYICVDPSVYDDAASNSGAYAYPYVKLSYVNLAASGYFSELGFDPRFPFAKFPISNSGGVGDTTFYCDYYYQASGDRTAFVGGDWFYTSAGGPFSWYLAYSLGFASIARGARLSYRP